MLGKIVAWGAVGAALIAGSIWLYSKQRSNPVAPAAAPVALRAQTEISRDANLPMPTSATRQTVSASGPIAETRLPPADTKLSNIYPQLKKLADAGNATAACRLAYELNRCRTLPLLETIAKNYTTRLERVKDTGHATSVDEQRQFQIQREYERAASVCSEFPRGNTDDGWRYALQAAQAGSGPAIMDFVGLKMGLDERHPDNTADGWMAYKELGPGLLQRALDMGMPEAYEYAASLHAWKNAPHQLVPYNPTRALAMYKALSNVATDDQYRVDLRDRINSLKSQYPFSAEEEAKADAESARITAVISQNAAGPIDGKPKYDPGAACER